MATASRRRPRTASRPISARFEPVELLRGFKRWFLSYAFLSRLPDPHRLAVPARPVVVRAAPASPAPPGSAAPSFSQAAATARRRSPFTSARSQSASWRTVSMFRTAEIRPVPGASFYSGTVVLSWLPSGLQPPLPPPSGGSFPPVLLPSSGVLANEAYGGSLSFALPVFPLPVTGGWNTGPWAFSRASHPAVTSDACQERERALSTRPELTADQSTLHFSYLTQAVRPHVAPRSASSPTSPP